LEEKIRQQGHQPKIVIVVENASRSEAIASELKAVALTEIANASILLSIVTRTRPDVVIADLKCKQLELIAQAVLTYRIPMILVSEDVVTPAMQAEAVKKGAFDYVQLGGDTPFLATRTAQLIDIQHRLRNLEREANRDSLSGLPNRREFRFAIAKEVERWRR
jgi:PleD family two-component response regulator